MPIEPSEDGYTITGLDPPGFERFPDDARKMYYDWVVEIGLRQKDRDLAKGLDAKGEPFKAISRKTRKYRKSAMTPSGKGDPNAPPLIPGWQKSRVRSLLTGKAFPDKAEFWWRYDAFTGDSFARILEYQRDRYGRDAFGLGPQALARVKAQAWERWAKWRAGKYKEPKPIKAIPAKPITIGRVDKRWTEPMGLGPPERHPTMTYEKLVEYLRQPAPAVLRGRPLEPKVMSPIAGPRYNILLQHIYGGPPEGPPRGGIQIAPPKPRPVPPRPPKPPKPPAAIAPPPPAKPKEPQPSGIPVADALVNQTKGLVSRAIQKALDAIAKVHGDGNLPKIPVGQTRSEHRGGEFVCSGISMRPMEINISSKASTPILNMVHETGHFIEWSGIPKPTAGPRNFDLSPQFKEWLEAVKSTEAVKELKALRAIKWMPVKQPDGTTKNYLTDQRYVRYLLQDNELWARSYAQYIAHKSEEQWLLKELDEIEKHPSAYKHAQWSKADFEPILKAIDAMFTALGWIV